MTEANSSVRVDKWLWAARFFKTRNKAKIAVNGGRVHVNGERCKVSRSLKVGDMVVLSRGETKQDIVVQAISDKRGNATIAQTLYQETDESVARREEARAVHLMTKAGLRVPKIRPSKSDRRDLIRLKRQEG